MKNQIYDSLITIKGAIAPFFENRLAGYFLAVAILWQTFKFTKNHIESRRIGTGLSGLRYDHVIKKYIRLKNGEKKLVDVKIQPKHKIKSKEVVLSRLNPLITYDQVKNDLPKLSNLFNRELFEVEQVNSGRAKVSYVLREDMLPKKTSLKKSPKSHFYAGTDGKRDYFLNADTDGNVLVLGRTGDGKTSLIKMLVKSFIESNSDDDIEILVLDYKGLDYTDLVKNNGATLIELNSLERLKEANVALESYISSFNASKTECKKHNITNYQDARDRGLKKIVKRYVFIFDEGGRYLNDKEGSPEERKIKQSIATKVALILATGRIASNLTILSTQRAQQNEIPNFPFSNFQTRILGNLDETMVYKYQDKRFKRYPLGQGRWTLTSSKRDCVLIRAPYEKHPFGEV